MKGHTQRLELRYGPADANPYDQAATGKDIQAGQFLRQDERLVAGIVVADVAST